MINREQILQNFPPDVRKQLESLNLDNIEEIRLRSEKYLMADRKILPCIITCETIQLMLQIISKASIYAYLDEIKMGYITVLGGHRVGICGRVIMDGKNIANIKNISGINFRIARQVKGCSDHLMPHIIQNGRIHNTLIISPIQCGKTTMLRDIARNISRTHKVSIVDERGEISAMYNGVPQHDVGEMTDTLDLCPKNIGIPIVLRSMSPDVIVTDELANEDLECIVKTLGSGTKVVATVHGDDVISAIRRINFEDIISEFGCIILLSRKHGVGTVEKIMDGGDVFAD